MKGYSFRSLTDLVLKIFKTKVIAGTGLSGGGSLEADRTLTVKYGTAAGTAAQGNDSRLSNSREWTAETISQAEVEVGTATTRRAFTAQRVRQAIVAWWNSITGVFGRDLVTSANITAARDKLGLFTSAFRWPTWAEVTGKPTTFTPSSHTHPWSQVTGQPVTATRWPSLAEVTGTPTNYPTTWSSVAAKPAQATRWPSWEEVTGKPIQQGLGNSSTNIMSQKAVTDAVNSHTPAGAVMPFAGVNQPDGWLIADGRSVSRTQYQKLFSVISTTYGDGDGFSSFNLPDLRGEFIRGFDRGRGVDSGRTIGSNQRGTLVGAYDDDASSASISFLKSKNQLGYSGDQFDPSEYGLTSSDYLNNGTFTSVTKDVANSFYNVTRPRNIALLYCIKT